MTPDTELARLFPEIAKPFPLEQREPKFFMVYREVSLDEARQMYPPIDPVDADETNHGVCAQGESDEQ